MDVLFNMDRAQECEDLEGLVANIKSIVESIYCSDKIKVQRVIEEIQESGY